MTDWAVLRQPGGFEYYMDALETALLLLQVTLAAVAGRRRSYSCSSMPALASSTLAIPGLSDFQMTDRAGSCSGKPSPRLQLQSSALPSTGRVRKSPYPVTQQKSLWLAETSSYEAL